MDAPDCGWGLVETAVGRQVAVEVRNETWHVDQ